MHNNRRRFQPKQRRLIAIAFVMTMLFMAIFNAPPTTDAQSGGQSHIVQSGENLYRIALRYGLTVNELSAANGITDPTRIYAGQVLVIPDITTRTNTAPNQANPIAVENIDSSALAPTATYHIVGRGETLAAIAGRYGVSWQDIATWNNLIDPNQIFAGQRLLVNTSSTAPTYSAVAGPTIQEATPIEAAPPNATSAQRTYTVRAGDTLASIAAQYNINWTTIARANTITNPNSIFSGQQLIIPASNDATGTYLEPNGGVPAAAAPTILTGKQVVVDLTEQRVYAYENGELLRAVTVSTGLPGTPTVVGDYRVYWKLTSQTMSGPGYYLPGVPWVMYFYQGYALHGTYWHNNFGQPMSHGCVNMPTEEAEWFFRWADVGTPVSVRY